MITGDDQRAGPKPSPGAGGVGGAATAGARRGSGRRVAAAEVRGGAVRGGAAGHAGGTGRTSDASLRARLAAPAAALAATLRGTHGAARGRARCAGTVCWRHAGMPMRPRFTGRGSAVRPG